MAKHQSEVAVQSKALNSPMGAIASMGDQMEVEMELEADVSGATHARARRWETIQVDEDLVERVLGVGASKYQLFNAVLGVMYLKERRNTNGSSQRTLLAPQPTHPKAPKVTPLIPGSGTFDTYPYVTS